jgi:hypothetical protein
MEVDEEDIYLVTPLKKNKPALKAKYKANVSVGLKKTKVVIELEPDLALFDEESHLDEYKDRRSSRQNVVEVVINASMKPLAKLPKKHFPLDPEERRLPLKIRKTLLLPKLERILKKSNRRGRCQSQVHDANSRKQQVSTSRRREKLPRGLPMARPCIPN